MSTVTHGTRSRCKTDQKAKEPFPRCQGVPCLGGTPQRVHNKTRTVPKWTKQHIQFWGQLKMAQNREIGVHFRWQCPVRIV